MKKRISGILSAIVAFLFCAGCGGGSRSGITIVPTAMPVSSPRVMDEINAAPGTQVNLYANEVLGVYHENDSDRYTSWRVKCDAPYNNGIGAYPRAALDYNPNYFTNISEPGLIHPEWSRTWGIHYVIPENAAPGAYHIECSAVNNQFSTQTVSIDYTVNVSGDPKVAPYAVARGIVPNGNEYIIIHNTDGYYIGEVVIVTANQVIRPALQYSDDFTYVAFNVNDSGVGVREENEAQMYVSYYDTNSVQHTYVLPYPAIFAQRQTLRISDKVNIDSWGVKNYSYKYNSSSFSDR